MELLISQKKGVRGLSREDAGDCSKQDLGSEFCREGEEEGGFRERSVGFWIKEVLISHFLARLVLGIVDVPYSR